MTHFLGAVANVFMVCGRLYTIDDYKSRHLSGHQWGYDTNTGEEFTFGKCDLTNYNG